MLIPNARHLWHRLWSVRLAVAGAALGSAAGVLQFMAESRGSLVLTVLASAASLGAAVARVVAQPRLRDGRE